MLETCIQQLGQKNLRITKNRETLLLVLHTASRPLSPPELVVLCHQAGRRANKTSIYRELSILESLGLVKKVMVSDRKQYFELTERGHHHHLICARCNTIEDITFREEDQLLEQGRQIARQKGFSVTRHSVEFFGLCKQCT